MSREALAKVAAATFMKVVFYLRTISWIVRQRMTQPIEVQHFPPVDEERPT